MGNKHLSVLMLYVRGAIAPLISIMVLMAAVQTGLSLWSVQRGVSTLEVLVQFAHWRFIFLGGVILLVAMLSRTYGGGYTIRRLRISERAVFLWHSLACFCCFVLLWMVEIIVSTVLCQYFLSLSSANDLSGQALFLAFYRSDFLHSILPLEEVSRWIYLLTAFLAMAFSMADAIVRIRYGHKATPLLLTLISALWLFQRTLGSLAPDVFLALFHLCIIAYTIWDVWCNAEEVASDDEN